MKKKNLQQMKFTKTQSIINLPQYQRNISTNSKSSSKEIINALIIKNEKQLILNTEFLMYRRKIEPASIENSLKEIPKNIYELSYWKKLRNPNLCDNNIYTINNPLKILSIFVFDFLYKNNSDLYTEAKTLISKISLEWIKQSKNNNQLFLNQISIREIQLLMAQYFKLIEQKSNTREIFENYDFIDVVLQIYFRSIVLETVSKSNEIELIKNIKDLNYIMDAQLAFKILCNDLKIDYSIQNNGSQYKFGLNSNFIVIKRENQLYQIQIDRIY